MVASILLLELLYRESRKHFFYRVLDLAELTLGEFLYSAATF